MMDSYPIGYRKPPAHKQFQKGQSGNPRGRPKGTRGPLTTINKIFTRKFKINEGGIPRTVEAFELIMLRLVEQATKGNPQAIRQCLEIQRWLMATCPAEENSGPHTVTFSIGPRLYFLEKEHHKHLTDEEIYTLNGLLSKLNRSIRDSERGLPESNA